MSTVSTTGLYAEDLLGTNPANRIVDELHTLQVPGANDYYFIIPKAAPFFADSLIVKNAQTGAVYKENDDYMYGHRFVEAMDSIGRPIAGSIRFMKRTIVGQVKLTYRTIGGQWGFSDASILAELSNKQLNPLIRSWGQIDTLPALFPVLEHNESIDSLIGSKEITDALKRLADVIEAGSEGTSQSHITNYNNPHRVTKEQVLLGNVPNYAMAGDVDARAGIRADLFLSPRGAQLLVQDKAITPMNAHITQTGNVHGLTAADINLGNVPNYKAATVTQAIDVTNNNTLLTPYLATLLIEKVQNVARIDDLENLITQHINNKNNPHDVTPAKIGTLTTDEIMQRIGQASGGGDAATFGGKTPEQWQADFVAATEIDTLLDKLVLALTGACDVIDAVVVVDTTTPQQAAALEALRVSGAIAGFDTYFVNNNDWDGIPVQPAGGPFPALIANAQNRWVSVENAKYYLTPRGGIISVGAGAIQAPVGFKDDASFNSANACNAIWATKNALYARKRTVTDGDGEVRRFKADNSNVAVILSAQATRDLVLQNERSFTGEVGLFEYVSTPAVGQTPAVYSVNAYGVTAFATPMNAAIATITTGGKTIESYAVTDTHIWIVLSDGTIHVYVVTHTGVTPTGVTKVTNLVGKGKNGTNVTLSTVTDAVTVSGAYGHVGILREDGSLIMYGDNSAGQLEVEDSSGPFVTVSCGYNFTVTVNDRHVTQFWGDSEDNSLYYGARGTTIDPEA